MEAKKELEVKAKSLVDSLPEEAIELYLELWKKYPDQFNNWDAFFALKALRASNLPHLSWASELAEKFKDDKVKNIYGWIIFDKCVKGKSKAELLINDTLIEGLIILCPQKNRKEDDKFPCPTTISVLKLCSAHAENLFNANKIDTLLSGLDYQKLSDKPSEKGDDEFSSDLEKYLSLKSKALFKLGKFESCKECSIKGIELLQTFHNNNDTWFKMRIALSEEKLGNHEKSEQLLRDLIESKEGNDKWFFYKEISEIYFDQKNFKKAWKYAVDATFYGIEPHFLIGLYLLQARILFNLERQKDGKLLAELIAAVLREQEWREREDFKKLFLYYKIDKASLRTLKEVMVEANLFWKNERFGGKSKQQGKISTVHINGKFGRIKDEKGNIIGFKRKDFVDKIKLVDNLVGALVEYFLMESWDGKSIAENIIITKLPTIVKYDIVGKVFEGTIKNIADFGVFVRIEGASDGLLHKKYLPNNFKEIFTNGEKVKVRIEKITERGTELKLVEKE